MVDQQHIVVADQVFDGVSMHREMAVVIKDGAVSSMIPVVQLPAGSPTSLLKGTLSPGFVDLQVNGGGGVLFNDDPTPGGLAKIAAAHRGLGTTHILPTVITDAPEVTQRAIEAVIEHGTRNGVLGIHIEGPHIAPARRGTHAERFVRPLDDETLTQVERLRALGLAVMITLAPEAATGAQIARLAATGAVVSLGHTDATADQTRAALSAGARCFTHLFNAMSPMLNRAPGVVGAAINSAVYAGIICDGIHVADEMVALAMRARPKSDRMFLVSDAMPTVGGPDTFKLYGETVTLTDGRLINSEGSLAGAHTTMLQSVRRLVQHLDTDLETALRMATGIPVALINGHDAPRPTIVGAQVDNLIVLDEALAGFRKLELETVV